MAHFSYLAVLGFILSGTLWLEYFLRTRVLSAARRLVLSIAPVLAVFADLGLVCDCVGSLELQRGTDYWYRRG